jgi:hypothetical protein
MGEVGVVVFWRPRIGPSGDEFARRSGDLASEARRQRRVKEFEDEPAGRQAELMLGKHLHRSAHHDGGGELGGVPHLQLAERSR